MSRVAACCVGVLLWLLGLSAPLAQPLRGPAVTQAVPAPAPIALAGERSVYSLAGRSRAWLDVTGFRSAEQVEAAGDSAPWVLHQRGRSYALQDQALWLQFDAVSSGERQWYLEVGSTSLEHAQLFFRDAGGRLVVQETGHDKSVADSPVPGPYPTFHLAGPPGQPVRYWLRFEQGRVEFAAPLRLYEGATLLAERQRNQFLLGAYFGLVGLIALGAAANALAHRDRNFAVFAVFVVTLGLGHLAAFGLGEQHLWPGWLGWNEAAMFLLPGISSATGLWFARTVTEPARFSRALDLAVWSLVAALLSAAGLDSVLTSPTSHLLVMVLTLLGLAVVAGLILLVWTQGDDPHMGLIAAGFAPVLLMGVLTVMFSLGLVAPGTLPPEAVSVGFALGLPILFYALGLRSSRRREAQVRASSLVRSDALTGVAHERALLQRLDSAIARASDLRQQCALLVLKISNFKELADEFGADAADRALVVTASLLRRAATDIDLEARVGEHHFALLLEGPTNAEAALNRAQELVARGLRSSAALPPGTTIKFHVALALLPEQQLDGSASLSWLLDAVNAMPADARKLIRPVNF